jgi:ABC-type sugar transport system ATPase subunit
LRYLLLAQNTNANLWFGGEKSTGKSETARNFAGRTGRSFTRINFHKYTTTEDYIGSVGLENGATVFKRGAFLTAFTSPSPVILLDEPTAGMSRSESRDFVRLIKEVTIGKTLLTVEHDMGVVFGLADKIAVVVYGEVIDFDLPENVRANPRVQEAYLGSAVADAQSGGH